MTKLTKQEVLKTIKLIDLGEYEDSLLDFFEELNELILNVTDEEKDLITKFVKNEISSWNNTSYEYQEYGNFLYKNIYTLCDYANCKLKDIPNYDDSLLYELSFELLPEIIKREPYRYPRYLEEIKIIKNGKIYEFSKSQTESNIKKAQEYIIDYIKSF